MPVKKEKKLKRQKPKLKSKPQPKKEEKKPALRKEKNEKESEIEELKKKNEDLSLQLIQMKTNLINKQLTTKSFKVELVKPKKILEIIFQKNNDLDNYEMVIKGRSKKDEHINLLDVSKFEISEKDKNKVDIEYMVSKNNINFL